MRPAEWAGWIVIAVAAVALFGVVALAVWLGGQLGDFLGQVAPVMR